MKKNFVLVVLIFFAIFQTIQAQSILKGVVKNTQNTRLNKVHLYIMMKDATTNSFLKDNQSDFTTDSSGTFQIKYNKTQEPVLYVEANGYERKKIKISSDTLSVVLSPLSNIITQNGKKIEEIPVRGVCGMCKKRIEETAYGIRGVQSAQWSAEKQALKVVYDGSKTDSETIQKRIALIGHDTPQYKADQATYDKLPACCHYRDGIKIH